MSLPTVHIDRWAFFNILISVTEVFKQESMGHLFGFTPTLKKNYFRVVNTFPFQHLKKRGFTGAIQSQKSNRLLTEMFSEFQGIQIQSIGGFHSHTQCGSSVVPRILSNADIQAMSDGGYSLEIITTLADAKKNESKWFYTRKGSVIGYHGGIRYVMDAFMLTGEKSLRRNIRRLRIHAPSAMRSLRRLHKKQ